MTTQYKVTFIGIDILKIYLFSPCCTLKHRLSKRTLQYVLLIFQDKEKLKKIKYTMYILNMVFIVSSSYRKNYFFVL